MTIAPADTPPLLLELGAILDERSRYGVVVDEPSSQTGEWWLDLWLEEPSNIVFSVSYRRGYGFGFYTDEPGFGERPYLICPDVPAALQELKRRLGEPSA